MVIKNAKCDLLDMGKDFASKDTSYSSFWLYNKDRDINSEHLKDKFVNFYNKKELLSEFNITVAKNIISFWSEPGDKILDPFAGRTRALVSYAMNRRYVGYEVSKDVVQHMDKRFEELDIKNDEKFDVEIKNKDCINVVDDFGCEIFDMVFTCPPYWNLEKYESCKGQLSDIDDYEDFVELLVDRLDAASLVLKKDKYMAVVVGDFRKRGKYITLHSDLLRQMSFNDSLSLHDVIAIQNIPFYTAAFYFGAVKKVKKTAKAHEYLLIWKKIK